MKFSKRFLIHDLAVQRIEQLFKLAIDNFKLNPHLSDRYVKMAIEISMRTRTKIPKKWKYFICRSCNSFLYPGIRARIRIKPRRSPHIVVTCLVCGAMRRYLIKKRKK
ncbi:MAG: hypothetical protein NZ922_03605 [Candidatus Methanomethyliaceae archaeon]|nr:hypothetical protein [Candidatus Methanomethyliaceae archaeon]MDW7970683.1 ribonuclease P [Nitrososphaerota archaeon]